jgi:hypothetical protein
MAVGIILGVTLVMIGLMLLAHLSYTNYGAEDCKNNNNKEFDPENPSNGVRPQFHPQKTNDCPIPLCFFQVAAISNHETWIVSFLMGGSAILILSLAVGY